MWVGIINEVNVHALITLALHGVNCSASRSGRFTPGEREQPARQRHPDRDSQTASQTDREPASHTDRQPASQTDSQTDRQAGSQPAREPASQAASQPARQTNCRFLQFVLFCPVARLTLRHDSSSCTDVGNKPKIERQR